MIKTQDGEIEIRGNIVELLADISIISQNLSKIKIPKDFILHAVEVGYLDEKELAKEYKKCKKQNEETAKDIDELLKFMEDLFKR